MSLDVLVVDDSAVVRQVMQAVLAADRRVTSVRVASDPVHAMRAMNAKWPDVVLLDVEMPQMDGITFLRKIMQVRPTPVVICSTLTQKGTKTSLAALAAGAVSIITKPTAGLRDFLQTEGHEIVQAVRDAAACAPKAVGAVHQVTDGDVVPTWSQHDRGGQPSGALAVTTERIVALGTSTGGATALETVLRALPRTAPGIVVVQHMPERFTAAFAARLDSVCAIEVKEAVHGDRVLAGRAIIAPGGRHLSVHRDGAQYRVAVLDGPPVNRHRPSVDVLFRSVADSVGPNAMGVIMTGMGDDGARGLKAMREAGAVTVAQDAATCVVHGMPAAAVALGAVQREVPLGSIAGTVVGFGAMTAGGAAR